MKTTSDHIYNEIAKECDGGEWACIGELANATASGQNYLDAWRVNLWPSKAVFQTFEIKVNRSDFLNEIKNPDKRMFGLSVSNEFYFATSAGVVNIVSEIPDECGWILYLYEGTDPETGNPIYKKEVKKKAPHRELPDRASWGFVRSLTRRMNSYQSHIYEKQIRDSLREIVSGLYNSKHDGYDRLCDICGGMLEGGQKDLVRKIAECFHEEEYIYGRFANMIKAIEREEQKNETSNA